MAFLKNTLQIRDGRIIDRVWNLVRKEVEASEQKSAAISSDEKVGLASDKKNDEPFQQFNWRKTMFGMVNEAENKEITLHILRKQVFDVYNELMKNRKKRLSIPKMMSRFDKTAQKFFCLEKVPEKGTMVRLKKPQ